MPVDIARDKTWQNVEFPPVPQLFLEEPLAPARTAARLYIFDDAADLDLTFRNGRGKGASRIARLIPAARMMCVFASEIVIQWPAVGIPQP